MGDLDHFKEVNDEFGHDFGDATLRHVANVLREAGESGDMVLGKGPKARNLPCC